MELTSLLELGGVIYLSYSSVANFLSSKFSNINKILERLPLNLFNFNEILARLPLKFLNEDQHRLVVSLISGLFTCGVWVHFFFNNRIEPSSTEGIIALPWAVLAGPIMVLAWAITALFRREVYLSRKVSWNGFWIGILILVIIAGGFSGFGIYLGVTRPLENGVVVAKIEGLDKQRFWDELILDLQQVEHVRELDIELDPKYYGWNVTDDDTAKEAARVKNQRFVVWGTLAVEEVSEGFLAKVRTRVFDATQGKETFSPEDYTLIKSTQTEITKRVAKDLTIITVWSLGCAELGWHPTSESVALSSRIFNALSDEYLHDNIREARNLGLLLQDIGFLQIYKRFIQDQVTQTKANEIFNEAIGELGDGPKSALARLYNCRAELLIDYYGIDDQKTRQEAESHLRKAIEKDENYPMPYINLAWIILDSDGSEKDVAGYTCDFLKKFEERYGQLPVEDRNQYKHYLDTAYGLLETLAVECGSESKH